MERRTGFNITVSQIRLEVRFWWRWSVPFEGLLSVLR